MPAGINWALCLRHKSHAPFTTDLFFRSAVEGGGRVGAALDRGSAAGRGRRPRWSDISAKLRTAATASAISITDVTVGRHKHPAQEMGALSGQRISRLRGRPSRECDSLVHRRGPKASHVQIVAVHLPRTACVASIHCLVVPRLLTKSLSTA